MLEHLLPQLEALESWNAENIEKLIHHVCQSQNVGMGKVAQPLRVAVTGSTISPGITDTLILLGKQKTLKRVRRVLTTKESMR